MLLLPEHSYVSTSVARSESGHGQLGSFKGCGGSCAVMGCGASAPQTAHSPQNQPAAAPQNQQVSSSGQESAVVTLTERQTPAAASKPIERVPPDSAAASMPAQMAEDMQALSLAELVAGLEHAILMNVRAGISEALGVTEDEDISAKMQKLPDRGADMLDKFCIPRIRAACLDGIDSLLKNEIRTVKEANSKYAEDPRSYSASFGIEEHFYQGLDEFNGRPDGDNIEAQMKREFQKTEPFKTRNYGGISTTLKQEWEFVESPSPDVTYPGEVGLPKGDGTFYPSRVRNTVKHYMDKKISRRAGLLRAEVIAVRLYTGPAYMKLNLGLRSGGRRAAERNIANFPATCSALNSAIKKLARVTPLPPSRKLYRGLSGMALPDDVIEVSLRTFAFRQE